MEKFYDEKGDTMSLDELMSLQQLVFSKSPDRRRLMLYSPESAKKTIAVQVFRNHSFELIEHTIAPYLSFAGISAVFSYGGYDDSFSFHDLNRDADLLILWIDTTRYKNLDIQSFFEERVAQLRAAYSGAILVVPFGAELSKLDHADAVLSLNAISNLLGERFLDLRVEKITGTKLSRFAMLEISRELGLKYIPAVINPAIKAIVVDLDNTLYQGVLGEDGIGGIILSDGHKQLQEKLKKMAASGVFLCVASKNNPEDVFQMFRERKDFPLTVEDFSKISASWNPKPESIQQIADFLNIGVDSILFVDDNIGELAAMHTVHPEVKLLLADPDGEETRRMLEMYPGLLRLNSSREDQLRKADVQANELRDQIRKSLSNEDFIRSLHLRLTFEINNASQAPRISELSNKTNQFIFNFQRYSETEVLRRFADASYAIITVSLSDSLSDSGLIGVLVGRRREAYMELEECFISCRALGRGIDDMIVLGAIHSLMERLGCSDLQVDFQKGPRNHPAEAFVDQHLKSYTCCPKAFSYHFPEDLVEINFVENKGETK